MIVCINYVSVSIVHTLYMIIKYDNGKKPDRGRASGVLWGGRANKLVMYSSTIHMDISICGGAAQL